MAGAFFLIAASCVALLAGNTREVVPEAVADAA
jgi:hypothetical protein